MNIIRYEGPGDFIAAVESCLLEQEVRNSLLLGNALRQLHGVPTHPGEVYYAAAFAGEALVGAASQQPPFPVILSAEMAPEVSAAFARALLADEQPVSGVIAPRPQAEAFTAIWRDLTGQAVAHQMGQGVYALREVRYHGSAPGALRPATAADLSLLTRWIQGFHDEATPHEPAFDAEDLARRRLRDASVYLWEAGGEIVSMAAKARPTRNGITVNLVYTPPELRGRGYATACVAALSQALLDSGRAFCTLFTDLANPTSNHIYQRIGYDYECDFLHIRFEALN
ncbi:MAG: GNAT family N-acetyltransferase [Anaerolineae bacterium]|nr:GNAT family N-acetyltransferase [Anaerolineae bacterium]